MAKPINDNGHELDANFAIEADPKGFDLVLESRGGSAHGPRATRNGDYATGLILLLERLSMFNARLNEVQIASSKAMKLPPEKRKLDPVGFTLPLELKDVDNFENLRLAIGRATGAFGAGIRAGTYAKRLRLKLTAEDLRHLLPAQIEQRLADVTSWDEKPTADPKELERRSKRARKKFAQKKGTVTPPSGSTLVPTTTGTVKRFLRDPEVVAWVLLQAGLNCESCNKPATFCRDDGTPYLEVHHVKHLADGGPDTVDNAIACCPNCHRGLHYGKDRDKRKKGLFENLTRLMIY